MTELVHILEKTVSPDHNELQRAQAFLEQAAQTNFPEYIRSLSEILANANFSPVARMASGLQLKNLLTSKDPNIKAQYQNRWVTALTDEIKTVVKKNVLGALGTETTRPSSAAQCVAYIAVIELGLNQWHDLIPTLVNNVASNGLQSSELLKEASLEAIGYICADIDPQILASQSNNILTAIVHGMKREEPSNRVRLAATNALLNSLEFTKSNFETESERHYIMQVVCEATQVNDTQVKVAALQCLVKIMSLYYQYMEFYMNLALFAITMEAMKSDVDDVALQGIEFWSNVCDEEVDLAIEASEATEFGRPPQRTSRFYAKGALQYLVPVLIQTLTKQQETNDDDDDWNPCKAAGVCLMLLANCCEDDIIPHVVPFVQSNITHEVWNFRDAAVMAFGCIMEGPDPSAVKPLAEEALPTLISLMNDTNVVVRDTTAWTLGRICEVVSDAALNRNHLEPLLDALVNALQSDPRVASNACWAISSLAEAAYEKASEGRVDESNEPETYELSRYFTPIIEKLLATTDRPDGNQANLRPAAYEALMEMIKNSPRDCYDTVKATTLIILERLRAVLQMDSVASGGDRTQYNELQSSLCATLQSVLRKVTPHDAPSISDAVMDALLQMLNGPGGRSGGVQEDALMAISTLTEVMGEGFLKYMDPFRPFLLMGLQNTTEQTVCSAAVGVSGDICRALGNKAAPYCDEIMERLLENLRNGNVHRSVKPQILSVLGDVALAIGPEFKKYLQIVLQTLVQASEAQVDRNDYEMVDYLCELREGVLEAYTGIIQGLRGDATSSGVPGGAVTPDLAMMEPHLPHIVRFICQVAGDQEKTDGNIAACAGLVGDLLVGYGASILQLVDNDFVTELLTQGRRSKTSKTKMLSSWASKELRKLKNQTSAAASCTKGSDTKNWDVFRNLPPEAENESAVDQACYLFIIKSLKIIAYIVTFIAVLAGAVVAKGSLLLMTSQLEPDRTVPICNRRFVRDKQYEAKIPEIERISWTWALLFAFLAPEIGSFIRSLRICVFKSWRQPSKMEFIVPFFFESCNAAGLALFVFYVLPGVNVVKAAMLTNCVSLIPAILGMLSRNPQNDGRPKWLLKCSVDICAIVFQLSGLLLWPLFSSESSSGRHWMLPLSGILISCGWWENYVDSSSPFAPIRALGKMRKNLVHTRYFTYVFISLWKMLIFFAAMILSVWIAGGNVANLFSQFSNSFATHAINVTEVRYNTYSEISPDSPDSLPLQEIIKESSASNAVTHTLVVQMLAAYICYIFGKFACKICIQGFSFAFPVSLAVPVTISILISLCGLRSENPCFWDSFLPQYLYWSCPKGDNFISDFIFKENAWVWLLWLLSQTWVALHIWTPKCERLASTERLFVTPMYSSLLIDQSLALNRKRDDDNDIRTDEVEQDPSETDYEEIRSIDSSHKEKDSKFKADTIPRIYACATMWHETKDEMMEMLKSIFRMDEDQCARRVALKYFEVVDPGYYEFETHIFFDDAFELRDEGSINSPVIVNPFVKLMCSTIEEAACHVHETQVRIRPPKKIPTPYGGRLEWVLPGKTKMIAHLKDKGKIRHRKRWSQVMYMYYLLGHKLMELNIPVARKEVIAENTYLLTLDGDIDFHPNAVELLVDLMKKNKNLGAACGRIHPIGSGPMVWYQMFEYAIGHWLQKATEHMIGCVLCSPGCFSLFRGKALMDDNVMAKYTTKSDEPRHYVQYDQGEDRWLCTLLLQRGYRVEYSAASDAKTHCPEGFSEFYNQRRRWVPSTMANIMDLLGDYKRTIKVNPDISMPYVIYQFMLMGGTILGPGTIFLMLVGAFVAAFRIDNWTSFYWNIYPIIIFMFVCFTLKANVQLIVAQILSTLYALVMMAVIVGTALQLGEDGIGSPSAIFLISLSGSFFIAALLHPQEFWCIVPGLLYLLSIPSMYLLLIIYSLINLNVVSWGTREVATKKSKQELEQEKKDAEEAKKRARKNGFLGFLPGNGSDDTAGSIEFSFAGLFKILCCTHQKPVDEGQQLLRIADSLEKVNKRLDTIEKTVEVPVASRRRSGVANSTSSPRTEDKENESANTRENDETKDDDDDETSSSDTRERRDDLMNPYWIEDRELKRGEVDFLPGHEIQFWKDLIEKYLKPIDADKKKEAQIAQQLSELRDRSVFFFFMINAIFVLIVFLMQLNKDQLHFRWPLGIKTNITYVEETGQYQVSKEYLQLEPIGLVFVGFFALILIIQFMAMLFHRFGTLSHILAATEIMSCSKEVDGFNKDSAVQKEGVRLIRQFQRLRNFDGDSDNGHLGGLGDVAKRKTIHNLEKQKQSRKQVGTLDVAFEKTFKEILSSPDKQAKLLRGDNFEVTLQALKERRSTVLERRSSVVERRKSQMETLKGPVLPPNGVVNGTLVPSSAASRTRGKAPKPAIKNIDFTNGAHNNVRLGNSQGVMNQAYIPDDIQLYSMQQNRRNSGAWRHPDPELGDTGGHHQRDHGDDGDIDNSSLQMKF